MSRRFIAALLSLLITLAALPSEQVRAAVPNAPIPDFPKGYIGLDNFAVTLQWHYPDCSVTQAEVQVYPRMHDGPAIDLIGNTQGACGSFFAVKSPPDWYGLLPDMGYYWRVRSSTAATSIGVDDPSWGPWSGENGFKTPVVSSASIRPVTPLDGPTVPAGPIAVQWSDSNSAVFYYEVQMSGDSRFDTNAATATSFVWWNLVHGGVTNPPDSWQTPALEPGKTYYWRVRPRIQGEGTPVPWGPTWRFSTK